MPLFPNRKCLLLFTSMGIHGCSFLAYNFLITTFCSCKRWPLQLIRRQLWELRVVCKGAGSLLLLPSSKILRVVHWHTWGIKVRGVPAPLKDLPMEMLGLTTFWKTLIFKVNRDPFHSASPPPPWPGSKILHTPPQLYRTAGTGPCQGAFGMETRGGNTHIPRRPRPSIWTLRSYPACVQEVLSRVKNAHLAPFGQKAPSAIVAEVIWGCCQLLQELAVNVWLAAIQLWEPVIRRCPRFGGACRCPLQIRTRDEGPDEYQLCDWGSFWFGSPLTVPVDSRSLHGTDKPRFHLLTGI